MKKLIPLFLLIPSISWGLGIASVVQSTGTNAITVNSSTVTFTNNVLAGHAIMVELECANNPTCGVTTISDSLGTTFTLALTSAVTSGSNCTAAQYYGVAPIGGADSVEVTLNNTNARQMFAAEIAGLSSTPFDVFSSSISTNSVSNITSPAATTSQSAEYLLASGCSNANQSSGFSSGPGFTLQFGNNGNPPTSSSRLFYEDQNIYSIQAATATIHLNSSSTGVILLGTYEIAPTGSHVTFGGGKVTIQGKTTFQ